jgi:hypothetical protein
VRLITSSAMFGLLISGTLFGTMATSNGTEPSPGDNNSRVAPAGNNTIGQSSWTQERMRKAKPMPLPRVDPKRDEGTK